MKKPFDARTLVHTPGEMMAELVEWAKRIQKDPGVKFGIPAIDQKVIPMRPGNLVCVIARPGHAKTSLLVYLARQEAARIRARAKNDGDKQEVVVYTTWEQTSEELTAMLMSDPAVSYSDIAWGKADVDTIMRRAVKGAGMPIWIIGHGISRTSLDIPRMTPELVLSAIESMRTDFGITPSLMLFDYLQLIPTHTAKERVQQVTEMPILLKQLAMRVGAPAVAAVQASRNVDSRTLPIPQMNDAQWASSIEQTADAIFSLYRPVKNLDKGDLVEIGEESYTVNDTLLIIKMLKQRGERGDHTWGMYFDPSLMRLAELETRQSKNYPEDY